MKIPTNKIKYRDKKIIQLCKWKKVLHIWACDSPYTKEKFYNNSLGNFLYKEIDKVSKEQVWIDLDQESVDFLNLHSSDFNNSKVICCDMNKLDTIEYKPDIIIFWDVIEHLMNLEVALSNIKKVMNSKTLLVISTPNAYSFDAILWNLLWKEFFHPDHKMTFTYWLLKNLLKYNQLKVTDFYFTKLSHESNNIQTKILSFISTKIIYYILPRFYETLLVIAKKEND